MKNILQFTRDPIWQAVGVLVSVLAIFLASSSPSPTNGELAIVKTQSISFSDYLLPSKLIKLKLPKASRDMDGAIVDYYAIVNKGNKPILPTDYTIPLTTELKSGGEIFLVDSCAQPNESLNMHSSSSSCGSASFVNTTWHQKERRWELERALLNPGEQFCVIVIRKSHVEPSNAITSWGGRVVGSKLTTYASVDEYDKSTEKNVSYYLQTSIRIEGFGAYWFAILQVTALYATLLLARQANWPSNQAGSPIWPAVVAMLLSTSTSEILVDIFVNQNISNLSAIVWPLLMAHLLLIVYLLVRAFKIRLSTSSHTVP